MKKLGNRSLVVVIGYRRVGGLTRCLKSIIKQLGSGDGVLIIDNQAIDQVKQEIDELKSKYQRVEVVENNNSNIASARNLAISFARKNGFEYCLFLDDDCEAEKNWLENMIETAANSDNAVVVVGDVMYHPKNSIYSMLEERLWKGWIESGRFGTRISDIDTKNCLLNICRLGGIKFDEGQNKIGRRADIKLAIRLNQVEKKIYFSEKSTVKHFERSTFLSYLKKRMDLVNSDKNIHYSADLPKPPTNSKADQITILGNIFKNLLFKFRFLDMVKLSLFILIFGNYKFIRKII